MLYFELVIKTIITLGAITYISIYLTFGRTSSCANFGLLAEPMADVMNKSLYKDYLQDLLNNSKYGDYYKDFVLLNEKE